MKQSRATIRYAKSFIDISVENNVLDTSYNDMVMVNSICSSNKDFINLLKSPIIKTDLKIKVINELFSNTLSSLTLGEKMSRVKSPTKSEVNAFVVDWPCLDRGCWY